STSRPVRSNVRRSSSVRRCSKLESSNCEGIFAGEKARLPNAEYGLAMQLLRTETAAPVRAQNFIGGEWEDGLAHVEVRNPARPDEVVGTIVRSTPGDVNRAVAAAKAAQPAWGALGIRER